MFVLIPCDTRGCLGVFLDEDRMRQSLKNLATYTVQTWDVEDGARFLYIIPRRDNDQPACVTADIEVARQYQRDAGDEVYQDPPEYWEAEVGMELPVIARQTGCRQLDITFEEILSIIAPRPPSPTFDLMEMVGPLDPPESPQIAHATCPAQSRPASPGREAAERAGRT